MQTNEIRALFEKEFGEIAKKFVIKEHNIKEALDSKDPDVTKPGVYVYWNPHLGVVRVGVSFVNSRKRALAHIFANTGGIMEGLANDNQTRILLYNIRKKEDSHWIIALEKYFEKRLKPCIPPGRDG